MGRYHAARFRRESPMDTELAIYAGTARRGNQQPTPRCSRRLFRPTKLNLFRPAKQISGSRNNVGHDLGIVNDESLFLAIVQVVQILVIHPEQVQHGGLIVVSFHNVFGGTMAHVIGVAVSDTTFDSSASQPSAKALPVMVATALRKIGSAASLPSKCHIASPRFR